jgi:hypothetical protein
MKMISSEQLIVQLAKVDDYICIVELAMSLGASISQVRHRLKELGDRVEHNDRDEWRVVNNIVSKRILSEAEKAERDDLESTVQQAFFVAGKALKLLRDQRLYRETHATFDSYVRDRFDFTKRAAYYLIDAAKVVENLKSEQFVHSNKSTSVLPTKESQCRPLAKLPLKQQKEVWRTAVEKSEGRVPSARIVKETVKRIKFVDCVKEINEKNQPSFREVNYTAGVGVEYKVRLDEETYYRLQAYQDKIGSATKSGAVARLLDAIAEQE